MEQTTTGSSDVCLGRVLPTDIEVASIPQKEICSPITEDSVINQTGRKEYSNSAMNCIIPQKTLVEYFAVATCASRSKSANVTHENHLCKYRSLVHSPSSGRWWAIRACAAGSDCVWNLAPLDAADFPAEQQDSAVADPAATSEPAAGSTPTLALEMTRESGVSSQKSPQRESSDLPQCNPTKASESRAPMASSRIDLSGATASR